jgi:aquaporin Z
VHPRSRGDALRDFPRPIFLAWTQEVTVMELDPRKLVAEFFGTLMLVVIAVGVATESFGFKLSGLSYSAGVAATALAFGLVLAALAYAIGPISGAHVNPAVTLGFIATARMTLVEGVAYIVAQVAGAIAGAYLLYAMMNTSPFYSKSVVGLGADGYGPASHLRVNQGGAFLIEVVLTAVFVMVVLFATHKAAIQGAAGVAIGFALVVVHLIGIPLTGTSVNPARSLGPALVVGGTALSQVWLFLVAPLVGGLVGAILHWLLTDNSKDETVDVTVVTVDSAT